MREYFYRHLQAFFSILGRLARAPLATTATVAVIGITLALPCGLYLVVDNARRLSSGWEGAGQISLFLKREVGEAAAGRLAERLRALPAVAKVEHITREAALAEFKRLSGFGEALDALGRNPLPAVLVVHPATTHSGAPTLEALVRELAGLREVDLAQLDLEWVRRLHGWLAIVERGMWLLAGLLGAAVLLIVGNTIRLAVLSRREEIEVVKLVGGTDAFIRRPFLYQGLIQGFMGAVLAWLLLQLSLWALAGPIRELADLYGSGFGPAGLGLDATALLLGAGAGLGWLGSRLAVGWHLRAIEPR